jgi:hypothetical protein
MSSRARLKHGLVLVVLATLASGARPSAESVLANQPPELVARLQDELVLVLEDVANDEQSFIVAYVLFERSRDEVVELLSQASRQSEYRPELKKVTTIRTSPEGRVDEQELKILFKKLTYRLRYRNDPETGRVTWALDPDFDNDLARMDGFWELYAFDAGESRTLGRFGSNVQIGGGVPKFVQKGMSRKTVLRYVRNFRQWIDSNGEWRP